MPASEFDVAVGARLRARRKALGMTMIDVADPLAISVQQLHKLEMGTNRLRAEQIVVLADTLDISVGEILGRPAASDYLASDRTLVEMGRVMAALPETVSRALMQVARFVAPEPRT